MNPATVLSLPVIVITMLALALGFLTRAVNTGSFLGQVTVPKPWLPWLTLLGAFLAALVASLQAANPVNALAVFNAVVAGLVALMGVGTGSAAHALAKAHLTPEGLQATARAKARATSGGFSKLGVTLGLAAVGVFLGALVHCTPAQSATTQKIVQTIVADLQAGASDGQMASDVCADLGGTAITDAVCAGATEIVADVVDMLINDGQLTSQPTALAAARGYKSRHATTRAP